MTDPTPYIERMDKARKPFGSLLAWLSAVKR